jgi:hypothetical protein
MLPTTYTVLPFQNTTCNHAGFQVLTAVVAGSYWFPGLAYSSTLKMEAVCSSEMSVDFQRNVSRYIPEDRKRSACCLLHDGFFFGLLFDYKNGGDFDPSKSRLASIGLSGVIVQNTEFFITIHISGLNIKVRKYI